MAEQQSPTPCSGFCPSLAAAFEQACVRSCYNKHAPVPWLPSVLPHSCQARWLASVCHTSLTQHGLPLFNHTVAICQARWLAPVHLACKCLSTAAAVCRRLCCRRSTPRTDCAACCATDAAALHLLHWVLCEGVCRALQQRAEGRAAGAEGCG